MTTLPTIPEIASEFRHLPYEDICAAVRGASRALSAAKRTGTAADVALARLRLTVIRGIENRLRHDGAL